VFLISLLGCRPFSGELVSRDDGKEMDGWKGEGNREVSGKGKKAERKWCTDVFLY